MEGACSSCAGDAVAVLHKATEGCPFIWVELQVFDLLKMAENERDLLEALNAALQQTTPRDLMWHVTEDRLPVTYIIPTYGGKALDRTAWQYNSTATLFGSLTRDDPSLWWKWLRRPVVAEEWSLFGLQIWSSTELARLQRIHESLAEAWTVSLWGRAISRLTDLDPVCQSVVENAAEAKIQEMGTAVDRAINEICEILGYWECLSPDEQGLRPGWSEVVAALFEVVDLLENKDLTDSETSEESLVSVFFERMKRAVDLTYVCPLFWIPEMEGNAR